MALLLPAVAAAQETPPANAAQPAAAPSPVQPPVAGGQISGTVKAGNVPLPGVTVSAANTLTGQKVVTSSDAAGEFSLQVPGNGRWVVRAEFSAFAPATQEALINAGNRAAKVTLEMQLLSRVQAAQQQQAQAQQQQAQQLRQLAAGGAGAGRGFQNLAVNGSDMGGAAADTGNAPPGGGAAADPSAPALPNAGMNPDAATESVAVSGQMGRSENFGSNLDDLQNRLEDIKQRLARGESIPGLNIQTMGGPPGGGFPGGGGDAGGRVMIMMGGPGGGGFGIGGAKFNVNRPHGMVSYNLEDAALDATPYALNGVTPARPSFAKHSFSATVGGPLNIPHLYQGGTKTFFFASYNGRRAADLVDQFATVPTLAERGGDFSGVTVTNGGLQVPVQIFNPVTHQAYTNNQVPLGQMNAAALGLLKFIPQPNQPGVTRNFHFANTADSGMDNINLRIIHNFGAPPQQRDRGQRAGNSGGGGRGGRGGGGGGRGAGFNGPRNNLNFGFNLSDSHNQLLNVFPAVAGTVRSRGINVSGGWNRSFGRWNNNARASFNRNRTQVQNLYGGVTNVEANLGISGVSTNPFDWGVPGLGFSHFNGLADINPSLRRDQTWSLGDNLGWVHGKHNWRFGGDFRRVQLNPKTDQNARGSFTFTGFATAAVVNGQPVPGTGFDFADFLLGLPQQTAAQFGANSYYFRGNSWDAYVQDDWKLRSNVTLQLGLRYEYVSPFQEKYNCIANLDTNRDFTDVFEVTPTTSSRCNPSAVPPGPTGKFTGKFPAALVNPDRNNFAPRVGIAWKPFPKTVVRTGYGINYNTGAYAAIVQQMAFQPPFNFAATNIASASTVLTLQNGFPTVAPGTVTNNFGVDRNYALGYVQTWNFDVQQEVTKSLMLNAGYTGAKGTRLDMLRAPNRTPTGLRIAGVEPFTWQTAEGDSTMNSLDLRLRKRMVHGISAGGTYTWSKALDNASSIGGSGHYVAQNDQDLRAERGLSSFDVRHRLSADYVVELPFGKGKHWLSTESWRSRMFGDWMWSGNLGVQTGSPFTAIVLGDFVDVARGSNGSLRANLTGQPVALSNPTLQQWFNTAAFVAPPRGQFGDSRRNLIEGPGGLTFSSSVNKTITIHESQALELRIGANNAFNHPRFNRIDSTVNSPTFGQVTGVGGMRQVNITLRYRF